MADTSSYADWVAVFRSTTDYEADLVRDRLDNAGIPAVVLTQRDHVFNLNVGDLAKVAVLVPPDREADARALAAEPPFTDDELTQAALAADPEMPDAHDPEQDARLDSGPDSLHLRSSDPG